MAKKHLISTLGREGKRTVMCSNCFRTWKAKAGGEFALAALLENVECVKVKTNKV